MVSGLWPEALAKRDIFQRFWLKMEITEPFNSVYNKYLLGSSMIP